MRLPHLPTYLLIFGYPLFWIELYLINLKGGHTSFAGPVLFFAFSFYIIICDRKALQEKFFVLTHEFKSYPPACQLLFLSAALLSAIIFFIALLASFYPVQLIQESDALTYHISLPRQHLILESFQHIRWAAADLWPLPVQFALAPYWLCTAIPNKIPQFIFMCGLLLISIRLLKRLDGFKLWSVGFLVFMILGSHVFSVQLGTAMLDLVLCYLFLAALDSFLGRNYKLALVEFCFLFWSKPLIFLQLSFIFLFLAAMVYLFKKLPFKAIGLGFSDTYAEKPKRLGARIAFFVILSIFIGGPFIAKSVHHAGTPFYPVGIGMLKSPHADSGQLNYLENLKSSAEIQLSAAKSLGYGRSLPAFLQHFWIIAIPEAGVNNKYDYPVGLPYLLCLFPFLLYTVKSVKDKRIALLPWLVIAYWISWWFSSQQTRFLFIPLVLMFVVIAAQEKLLSKVFLSCLILALIFTAISMVRSHKGYLGKPWNEVIRPVDQDLMKKTQDVKPGEMVELETTQAAYAASPVKVTGPNSAFIISY